MPALGYCARKAAKYVFFQPVPALGPCVDWRRQGATQQMVRCPCTLGWNIAQFLR